MHAKKNLPDIFNNILMGFFLDEQDSRNKTQYARFIIIKKNELAGSICWENNLLILFFVTEVFAPHLWLGS